MYSTVWGHKYIGTPEPQGQNAWNARGRNKMKPCGSWTKPAQFKFYLDQMDERPTFPRFYTAFTYREIRCNILMLKSNYDHFHNVERFQQAVSHDLIWLTVFSLRFPIAISWVLWSTLNNTWQYWRKQTRQLRAQRRGYCRMRDSLGFVSVSSHASFVLPKVNVRANLVHYLCVHLVKSAVDVHMTPGGTVQSFYDVKEP